MTGKVNWRTQWRSDRVGPGAPDFVRKFLLVGIMVPAGGVSRKTARLDVWTLAPYSQPFAADFSSSTPRHSHGDPNPARHSTTGDSRVQALRSAHPIPC